MGSSNQFPLLAFQEDLVHDEGLRLIPYKDALRNWTVGVGHYIGSLAAFTNWCLQVGNPSGSITKEHAMVILGWDIADAIVNLDRRYGWWRQLSPVRQRVIANMMFNMGPASLADFVATLKAMAGGRYADAATGMIRSKWATQVGDRAKRLAWMMEHDNTDFPDSIA